MAKSTGPSTQSPAPRRSPKTRATASDFHHEVSFQLLFTNNPQPMWVYDLQTLQFLEVNEAAVAKYGYSSEEFLKLTLRDIRPAQDVPHLLQDIARTRVELQASGEWRHLTKSGQIIDVDITSHVLRFREKRAVLVMVKDVTQRKKAEAALREAELKYRSLFEQAMIGMFQSTPAGRLLAANLAMARILGYASVEELLAGIVDIKQQLYVQAERRDEFRKILEEQGTVQNFESQVYRKDHSKMWICMSARAVREDGAIVRYEGTLDDISERKLLEEQLRQSQKMEAVGRLAGGVAHDFNNALGVITGYSDLMQMRLPEGDPLRKYADEVAKAGHRAAALTRQLLAFSRKQVIQPVILDLNGVVEEMGKMLQRLIGENIEIIFTRGSELGRIKADPGQLEQVLMNLAVNARDAMPNGGKLFIQTVERRIRRGLCPPARLRATRPLRDAELQRHRLRHGERDPGPHFRAVLHHQGSGQGNRPRIVDGLWHREAERRLRLGLQRARERAPPSRFISRFAPAKSGRSRRQVPSDCRPRGSGTILVVEDEEPLRELARTCLEAGGYRRSVSATDRSSRPSAAAPENRSSSADRRDHARD